MLWVWAIIGGYLGLLFPYVRINVTPANLLLPRSIAGDEFVANLDAAAVRPGPEPVRCADPAPVDVVRVHQRVGRQRRSADAVLRRRHAVLARPGEAPARGVRPGRRRAPDDPVGEPRAVAERRRDLRDRGRAELPERPYGAAQDACGRDRGGRRAGGVHADRNPRGRPAERIRRRISGGHLSRGMAGRAGLADLRVGRSASVGESVLAVGRHARSHLVRDVLARVRGARAVLRRSSSGRWSRASSRHDPVSIMLASVVYVAALQAFFYNMFPSPLPIILCAVGLLFRERRSGSRTMPRRRRRNGRRLCSILGRGPRDVRGARRPRPCLWPGAELGDWSSRRNHGRGDSSPTPSAPTSAS